MPENTVPGMKLFIKVLKYVHTQLWNYLHDGVADENVSVVKCCTRVRIGGNFEESILCIISNKEVYTREWSQWY
jgi:hypothetical protein